MDPYEKLIGVIRKEAGRDLGKEMFLGIMTAEDKCLVGSNELDKTDLMKAKGLSLNKNDNVLVCKVSSGNYIILAKVVSL